MQKRTRSECFPPVLTSSSDAQNQNAVGARFSACQWICFSQLVLNKAPRFYWALILITELSYGNGYRTRNQEYIPVTSPDLQQYAHIQDILEDKDIHFTLTLNTSSLCEKITLYGTMVTISITCITHTQKKTLHLAQICFRIVTCIPIARQRLGKHIPAEENARNNRTSIARQRISKNASLTIEAVFTAWSVQSGYKEVFSNRVSSEMGNVRSKRVPMKNSSFELVVRKRVEFWRWQSKVIEKKWQQMK
jgi:hypothetical protein